MADRETPHSLEAERAVLGAVLVNPQALEDLADLGPDDLLLPAHRDILAAMRAIGASGRPVDVLLLTDELKARGVLPRLEGGVAYLNDLANGTPVIGNVRHYVAIVREKAIRRRLLTVCAEIQSRAYEQGDVEELLSEARLSLASIESAEQGGPTRVGDELGPTIDSMERRADKPGDYFVQTGIRAFDEKVTGLRGGNLIVIAGRPGDGKSAYAVDILLNAARNGIPVLLFSFEMTKMEIVERMLAKWGSVDGMKVGSGRMSGPEWQRVHDAASRLYRLPFWLDSRNMSAPRICSVARQWLARQRRAQPDGIDKRLAAVAVDYVGLVKSTGNEQSREREVAMVSSSFKQLAEELQIPVIAISQINRESEKTGREPRISDLRESGAIEQDANMILFPYRDPANAASTADGDGVDAKIIIAKNRSGAKGFVWVKWQEKYVRFTDVDHDGPQQEALL